MAGFWKSAFLAVVAMVVGGVADNELCRLEVVNQSRVVETVNGFLNEKGAKLIRYNVGFVNYTGEMLERLKAGGLVRPHEWIRTVNRQGMNLLMFDDNFELLSLRLLTIGLYDMNVQLVDNPKGCLVSTLNTTDRLFKIRSLMLTDFRNTSQRNEELGQFERVCNKRVYIPADQTDKGAFTYSCCHGDNVMCYDVKEDTWILILNYILGVGIVIFILYCPWFLSVMIDNRETEETTDFVATLPEKCSVKLEKETNGCVIHNGESNVSLEGMATVQRFLTTVNDPGTVDCHISDMTISVPRARLLPLGCYPVSIFRVFYDGIFHCSMATSDTLRPCCMSTVCCKWCPCGKCKCKWLSVLSILSRLLLLCIFLIPFAVEIYVYYTYIRPVFDEESNACSRINSTCLPHKVFDVFGVRDLSWASLAIWWGVAVLSGLIVEYVLGRLFAKKAVFSTLLIKSQKEYAIFPIVKLLLETFISPFKDYGILGLLLFPLYIPKLIAYILYSVLIVFPLMKMIVGLLRFTLSIAYQESKDKKPIWRVVLESVFALIVYFIFIVCMLVLIVFCITFYTEIFFYTIIGIIANSDRTLPFVAMLLPLGVYTRQILGKVGQTYYQYLTLINQILLSRSDSDNGALGQLSLERYKRNVLCIPSFSKQSSSDILNCFAKSKRLSKGISYHGNILLVFLERAKDLDPLHSAESENSENTENPKTQKWLEKVFTAKDKFEKDITRSLYDSGKYYIFTPTELFMHIVTLDLPGSPGIISAEILQAFVRLAYVIGFLGFVVVAVMGLGNSYRITLTDQLMLTVVGGVVPLIFRYGLFNYRMSTINWDNEELKLNVIKAIEQYEETWEVVDMTLSTGSDTVYPDDVRVDLDNPSAGDELNTETASSEHKPPNGPDSSEGAVFIPMKEMGSSSPSVMT